MRRNINLLTRSNEIYSLKNKINYFYNYLNSLKFSAETFKDIKYFTIFLNPGRSGHSLIGAILDAHPNVIISHELDVLPLLKYHDFDIIKIYSLILSNSFYLAKIKKRYQTGFNYNINYKYSGKYKSLKVIGDKSGGNSCLFLMRNPAFIYKLLKTFGKKLKVLCVIRNPYDNICSMIKRNNLSIKKTTNHYTHLIKISIKIKKNLPDDQFFILKHESLINNPKKIISKLCSFYGLSAPLDYLEACSQIIFKKPHIYRKETEIKKEDIDKIKNILRKEDYFEEFFKNYKI